MCSLAEKIQRLFYWLLIFREGQGVKAKLFLIPSSLLRVVYYAIDMFEVPLIKDIFRKFVLLLSPSVIIKNSNGMFHCRSGGTDIQVAAEMFEPGLTRYFDEVRTGVFVDIGAHIGRYTVKVGRQMGDNGRVISIEPDPDNYKSLQKNIALNGLTNVSALNIACWNKTEELSLSLSCYRDKSLSSVKERVSSYYIKVKGMKLDEILHNTGIEHVDIIKIDTEGSEQEVIQGAIRIIEKSSNVRVIFEAWDQNYFKICKEVLEKCGMVVSEDAVDRHTYMAKKVAITINQ